MEELTGRWAKIQDRLDREIGLQRGDAEMWVPRHLAREWSIPRPRKEVTWAVGAALLALLALLSLRADKTEAVVAARPVVEEPVLTPPPVVPVVHQEPAPKRTPAEISIVKTTRLPNTGQWLIIVKVEDADGARLAGQIVEWSLDVHGVGQIIGVPNADHPGAAGERVSPTFARSTTGAASYFLDPRAPVLDRIEIGPGETWCLIESPAAGESIITALAPDIVVTTARQVTTRHRWNHVIASFPGSGRALAGAQAACVTRVTFVSDGTPAPGYRVRYTLEHPGGAALPNGKSATVITTDAKGEAILSLKQAEFAQTTSRVRAEVLGHQLLHEEPTIVLSDAEFEIDWVDPGFEITASAQSPVRVDDAAEVRFKVTAGGEPIPAGYRLVAVVTSDLWIEGAAGGHEIDLGDPATAGPPPWKMTVRSRGPGARTLRLELRDGTKVRAASQVALEFAVPTLEVAKELPERWNAGSEAAYEVLVRNPGPLVADKIRVVDELPPGVSATHADALRFADHLEWTVDRLAPGDERRFLVRAVANRPIDGLAARTRAESGGQVLGEVARAVHVTGTAALAISVRDLVDPVPLEGMVEYLVTLENRGNAAAEGIEVAVDFPAELELVGVEGLLPARAVDGRLELGPIPLLAAGQGMSCQIRAKPQRDGEARLAVRVRHPSAGPTPLEDQESTILYAPVAAGTR